MTFGSIVQHPLDGLDLQLGILRWKNNFDQVDAESSGVHKCTAVILSEVRNEIMSVNEQPIDNSWPDSQDDQAVNRSARYLPAAAPSAAPAVLPVSVCLLCQPSCPVVSSTGC